MADITKCDGTKGNKTCPLKDTCYRHTAKPNEFWQSYFVEIPLDFEKNVCQYYWNDQQYKQCIPLNSR